MNESTKTDITATDHALLKVDKNRTWGQIADLIINCEQKRYWAGTYPSFTSWLTLLAESLGVKPATVWRYYSSGRFYQKLSKEINAKGIACLPLHQLPPSVSSENLEILHKLGRVTEGNVLHDIVLKVLSGSMSRADLRSTWIAYRTVLDGRTARGRGVVVPQINRSDPSHDQLLNIAEMFSSIKRGDKSWVGIENPHSFRIYSDVRPEYSMHDSVKMHFDVVVADRFKVSTSLDLHIVFLRPDSNLKVDRSIKSFYRAVPYCNHVWLAVKDPDFDINQDNLPLFVGIILVLDGSITVLRQPTNTDGLGSRAGDLAKALIFLTPAM